MAAELFEAGWSGLALGRLVAYEGLGIGVLGAVTGAAIGLGGSAWFAGELPAALLRSAAGIAVAGVLLAGVGALVPALLQRRLPISTLLAEE